MKMNEIVKTLLVCGVCVACVACGSKKSAKTNEATVVAKPKVTTEVVHIQDVEMISTFTGNVEGYAVNNISPAQNRRITKLLVDVGDRVKAGQKVAVLEAMKMENDIPSEVDGVVRQILVAEGDTLQEGEAMFVVE